MGHDKIDNFLRYFREKAGISQQALAESVKVSRQAIIAIEAGQQNPSTALSLQMARILQCSVEDLFQLSLAQPIMAEAVGGFPPQGFSNRVVLAQVNQRWVAHPLSLNSQSAADGIIQQRTSQGDVVEPLTNLRLLEKNIFVGGCAPLLSVLAQRTGHRYHDAHIHCLPMNSQSAIDNLEKELIHIAGIHFSTSENSEVIRKYFSSKRMLLVNLLKWQVGLAVSQDNPLSIRTAEDILRPKLRLVRREDGSGAWQFLSKIFSHYGLEPSSQKMLPAFTHEEVAQQIRYGLADAGITIESVALAAGLSFIPLAEERFDLVLPESLAGHVPVQRLLDTLNHSIFRLEAQKIPGCNTTNSGEATVLAA